MPGILKTEDAKLEPVDGEGEREGGGEREPVGNGDAGGREEDRRRGREGSYRSYSSPEAGKIVQCEGCRYTYIVCIYEF